MGTYILLASCHTAGQAKHAHIQESISPACRVKASDSVIVIFRWLLLCLVLVSFSTLYHVYVINGGESVPCIGYTCRNAHYAYRSWIDPFYLNDLEYIGAVIVTAELWPILFHKRRIRRKYAEFYCAASHLRPLSYCIGVSVPFKRKAFSLHEMCCDMANFPNQNTF